MPFAITSIPDHVRIKVKVYEGWYESPRLWVALIGPVSAKKSPAMVSAVSALKRVERQRRAAYKEAVAIYEIAAAMAEKDGVECEVEEPEEPPQLILNDTTIEAACDVIAANPAGVLLEHDELSGWFGAMDKYTSGRGSAADRAFWLQAWNGGPHIVNRRSRKEPLHIANLSVGIVGGIQPDAMRKVVKDTYDDGLIQRLIPVIAGPAEVGEDVPDDEQRREYEMLIARLTGLGEMDVKFSDAAQEVRRKLEIDLHKLSCLEDLSPRFAGFIIKLNGYFARIALVLHCCATTKVSEKITAATARKADRLIRDFIIPHARHFYLDLVTEGTEIANARNIAGFILAKRQFRFTFGDLTTNVRCCRKRSKDEVRRMVELLEMYGWVVPEQPVYPRSWKVNPAVHRQFDERAQAERSRRELVRAQILGDDDG